MAAAFHQKPRADGLAHCSAKIDAPDRTTGSCASVARLERDGKSRPPKPLPQPRGDQSHHPWMPPVAGSNDYHPFLLSAERGHRLGLSLRHGGKFDSLALAVEAIEFARNARTFGRILMHQ